MAGLPPRTDITRHSTIEETSATLGSTPETNENEITSGISASAVTMPASDSRTSKFGARSTAPIDGESSNWSCALVVVLAICMGISRKRFSSGARGFTHDTAEADMTGGGIDGLALTRRRPIAQAVIGGAEMRTALHYPAHGAIIAGAGVAA